MKKTLVALVLALCLTAGIACADAISLSGKVETGDTVQVYSPAGGTVEKVYVRAGETVTADTVIAEIRTNKVYASQDGTVTAVYGQTGDNAENVAAAYGAVMFLEGETVYTLTTSTSKGYAAIENYLVHSGEQVFLVSRNHTLNKGTGVITSVAAAEYTVLVTEGSFYVGDSIDVYRGDAIVTANRIGRGNIARVAPEAVTGTGYIVSYAVKPGDSVKRGQLLFETVDGISGGPETAVTKILAGTDGTVSELTLEEGAAVTAGGSVAQIYPKDAMTVTAQLPEADLGGIAVGQKVRVELDWNQDSGAVYEGTVEMISAIGTETALEDATVTYYTVYISFTPDADTRYGMTAVVSTEEEDEPREEALTGAADAAEEEAAPAEDGESKDRSRGGRQGRPEGGKSRPGSGTGAGTDEKAPSADAAAETETGAENGQ